MKEVSVVIPNYNGIKFMDDCLAALGRQSIKEFDVILVDNGSKDDSVIFTRQHYPDVRIIELEKNYGFCRAVNAGIMAASTPYVILLNNDTRVDRKFVEELLIGIKKDPNCFSGSARMLQLYQPDKIDDAGDYYCALGWAFAYGKDKPAEHYNKSRTVFASCAGAAIYRTSVFQEIGYFDEKHFAYLEDIDIGYRAKIWGYKNIYIPGAKVWHVGSGTTGSRYNPIKVRYSSRNNVYMIYKNMPTLQILLNSPLLAAGFLVKFLFFWKRGLGSIYMRGLLEGISFGIKGRKVKFDQKNFKNYCKIQWELWKNIGVKINS